MYPESGPVSGDGDEMRNGSALAVRDVNAGNGAGGRRLAQVVVDVDPFSEDSIRAAFEALAAADVDAIAVGYLFHETPLLEFAERYGAPVMHAMTSQRLLEAVRQEPTRFGHIFQVCPAETHYGPRFIRALDDLETTGAWAPANRRVAFVQTTAPSGQVASPATLAAAERSRWEVEQIVGIPPVGADWDSVVAAVSRGEPAAVMIVHFLPGELAEFQRRFALTSSRTLVYAVYTPSIPEFTAKAGRAADGMLWSTASGTYADAIGSRFAQRYAATFDRAPGRSHAGIAYDTVRLLAQAWASTPDPHDFVKVASTLRDSAYRGVNGAYWLGNPGQTGLAYPDVTPDPSIAQAHLLFQIQEGRHRVLGPWPYVEAPFRNPSWFDETRSVM